MKKRNMVAGRNRKTFVGIAGACAVLLLVLVVILATTGKKDKENLADKKPSTEADSSQNAGNDENEDASDTESEEETGEQSGTESEDVTEGVTDDETGDEDMPDDGRKKPYMFYTENGYTITDPENTRGLSNDRIGFGPGIPSNGQAHSYATELQTQFDNMENIDAMIYDNRSGKKVLYLTFDCGYEYKNNTTKTLDILKEKNVPAAFFCLIQFFKTDPEATQRMIDEGHIIGNHTANHPSLPTMTRPEIAADIHLLDKYLVDNFNYHPEYFRPPSGEYSENALDLCTGIGYRTVFWSIAYADWDPENQPAEAEALEILKGRLHPGAVILLHSVSDTNVAILGEFIDYARANGYEFVSLDEYPW